MMIRGLIFDFDGLILETEGPVYQSWCELYESQGERMPWDFWASQIGVAEGTVDLFGKLEQLVGLPLDRQALLGSRQKREEELIAAQAVLPGIYEYLQDARRLGLKTAIATSSSRSWIEGHLAYLGLNDGFDCIKCSDDVSQTKPSPELFLAVLNELKFLPGEALAFEDSPNGIKAARSAGIFTVAVPNVVTRHLNLEDANLCLDSLAEISLEALFLKIEKMRMST
jgi:HAD superfamily hydrolase (TIGR01509 family)